MGEKRVIWPSFMATFEVIKCTALILKVNEVQTVLSEVCVCWAGGVC